LFVAPKALGSGALAGEEVANYLLAFDPRVAASTAPGDVRRDKPIEDVPDLLSYLGRVGEAGVGQRVRVAGLVAKSGGLEGGEFPLLRYSIVHCVADARPVGFIVANTTLPLELDQWVRVE